MRPHRQSPEEASQRPPDLEIRRACFACGGDLSVRFGAHLARTVCRRCGGWCEAIVERDPGGVVVAQLPVGLA